MIVYSAKVPGKGAVNYVDGKRRRWLSSVINPLIPFLGIILHGLTGYELWLMLPLFLAYVIGPLMDWWLGEDENNPPEEIVPQLEEDRYYRWLTFVTVPFHFMTLIACAWWAATQDLSVAGYLGLAIVAGMNSGLGINTGHELGHKKSSLERWLAKLVLAVPAYGHFMVEHNRGHHVQVATPEDSASSRMGESIYRFSLREILGCFKRGWRLECERLERDGLKVWSRKNEILQSFSVTLVLQLGLLITLGWMLLPFLIIHNVMAWWQLTSANYVEHYGLLRKKDMNGRYERCQPHHSWNSNHIYSNLKLFHLERHSDHHANPTRRYQSLRHFDDVPRLPGGYYTMFLLAYIPPLWFRVVDPILMSLKAVNGNLDNVNVCPGKRAELYARYHQGDGSQEIINKNDVEL